jgi:hypothetical protein
MGIVSHIYDNYQHNKTTLSLLSKFKNRKIDTIFTGAYGLPILVKMETVRKDGTIQSRAIAKKRWAFNLKKISHRLLTSTPQYAIIHSIKRPSGYAGESVTVAKRAHPFPSRTR